MPDALSIGAQFVLYKPEGALNYFFCDYRTGQRVFGADLARAKILAETQGITVAGNADQDAAYVKDADLNVWRQAHPNAPTRPMPALPNAVSGAAPKISQEDLVKQMRAEIEEFKSRGTIVGTMDDGTPVHLVRTPIPGGQDLQSFVPDIYQSMPAIEFEQKYGLKDIAGHYKYPPGMTARDVEEYARMVSNKSLGGELTKVQMEEKLGNVRSMLEGLNPELKILNAGASETGTLDLILGVTSGYNPRDIQSFLNGNYRDTFIDNNPGWAKIINGLEKQGVEPGWVPSMETLQEIDRQVNSPSYMPPTAPAPTLARNANWQEATTNGGRKVTRTALQSMSEPQIAALENELRSAGFHPYRVSSRTLGETMRIPPEELENFNKWRQGEQIVVASSPRSITPPGGGNNGPVMSVADKRISQVELQLGRADAAGYSYSTPLAEGEVLVRRRRAGFTANSEIVNETARNTRPEAGFTSNLGETPIDASAAPPSENAIGFIKKPPVPAVLPEPPAIGGASVRLGTSPGSVLYTAEAANTALKDSFGTVAGEADHKFLFGSGLYQEPRYFEDLGAKLNVNPEGRVNGMLQSADNVLKGPKAVMPMPEGSPIFRGGSSLDELIASSRPSTAFSSVASTVGQSKLLNNTAVEAVSTALNSNIVKRGTLGLNIVSTVVGVSKVTGLTEKMFGPDKEQTVLGDGLLRRGQGYGMGGLSQFNSIAGGIPVLGQVTAVVTATAYHGFGLRSDSQLFLETVNAYNTKQESDEDRQKRWSAFTKSIPPEEFIRLTSMNDTPERREILAKNLTAFMKLYPDARLGDAALVMQDSNKAIFEELCGDHPKWGYISKFMDNAKVAGVRTAFAEYAAEHTDDWIGDKFTVPEAGNLFHLNGDHPYGIPGATSVNRDALVETYADRLYTKLNDPVIASLFQTGPSVMQTLGMTDQEIADNKRRQEEMRRQQAAADTVAARDWAAAEVDKTAGYLQDARNAMMTSLNTVARQCAENVDKAGIDMRDRVKKNQIDIDKADREIRKAADADARQYWENMKQLSVNDNETMKKWYQDVVRQQTEFLQDHIQKRVEIYTRDRDAYLFGGTFDDGKTTPGLQGALNSYHFSNGVSAPVVDIRSFVNEAGFMDTDPDQMMTKVVENGIQNKSGPAVRKPGT